MQVVCHYCCHVEVEFDLVSVNAAIEYDCSRPIIQHTPMSCAKGDEMRFAISLNVWKIAPIKLPFLILTRDDADPAEN